MESELNAKELREFAAQLEEAPLCLSSFEQVTGQLARLGVKHRLSCDVQGLHQSFALMTKDPNVRLEMFFPGGTLPVRLSQHTQTSLRGSVEVPWEFFYLQISQRDRSEKVRVYGPCSSALANNVMYDETVPVIVLYELAAALVELLVGRPVPPGQFHGETKKALHTAHEAARILRKFSTMI